MDSTQLILLNRKGKARLRKRKSQPKSMDSTHIIIVNIYYKVQVPKKIPEPVESIQNRGFYWDFALIKDSTRD
jgi:hypothetical protein